MGEKKLFLVTTKGAGDFYVIATSFDLAAELVKNELDDADYGYSSEREVIEVKLLCVQQFDDDGERVFWENNNYNLMVWGDGKESKQ